MWNFFLGFAIGVYLTFPSNSDNKTLLVVAQLRPNHTSASTKSENHLSDLDRFCNDCKLTSSSVEALVRRPRNVNSLGQVEDRIDLDKIKKAVCKDILSDKDRERCREFYFTRQETIAKWKSNPKMTFFDFVCIKELKICCPDNSYGPKCTKCLSCGPNEVCRGEGTRSGDGSCVCKDGHTGSDCTSCLPGFYPERQPKNQRSKNTSCKQCHRSCRYCHGPNSTDCEVCNPGFALVPSYGCSDIDECIKSNNKICGENTFCVNTEGSYFCYECDRSCDGCHGDGPDMCIRCGKGYKLENGNCVALKKTILPPEANYYRYMIYVGLCVCTCIILNNNIYLASLIGLSVALYIGFSEYIMSVHQRNLRTNAL